MAHILVNGISAKFGGGRSILTNFLTVLNTRKLRHNFSVVVPTITGYEKFHGDNVRILPYPLLSKQALLPFTNAFILPRLMRDLGCDIVFNPADLPIPTESLQLFLFDWPYAAYPDSIAWGRGGLLEIAKRKIKYYIFHRNLRYINRIIAQGPALRQRLSGLYEFEEISIVPNAVSTEHSSSSLGRDFSLAKGFKLLCLSHYYSHKNLEVFVDLGELIRAYELDWKIVITINSDQGRGARKLLNEIQRRDLSHIINNVGPVPMADVPSLYRQCDALLLPTLLESFSGTFVEAMFHGKPIFTSNYEFATDVCKDAAFYFDPLDVGDIFGCIRSAISNPSLIEQKIVSGKYRLSSMLNWEQAFDAYLENLDEMLIDSTQATSSIL